jgi:RimJ/RimL family protein N-acetyltransferase
MESTDAARLVRFHAGLSSETIRMRYFGPHPHLSGAQIERFTTVDHHDREAFVVVLDDDIIAVGRYDRLDDRAEAEVAFVVSDGWQRRGIAPVLLALLAERAREVGVRRFVAETLVDNHAMLDVFRHSGLATTTSTSLGEVQVTMVL